MRMLLLIMCAVASVNYSHGQAIPVEIRALNSYVDYANQSADEVSIVVQSIIEYHSSLNRRNWIPRYVCPVQPEQYYLTEAIKINKQLGQRGFPSANKAFEELKASAEKIDEQCKALDTYHKLEDYKQDQFARARELVAALKVSIDEYSLKQKSLQSELERLYKRITSSAPDNSYRQADTRMLSNISFERTVLGGWSYNLREDVHTGWPNEKVQQSITETDAHLAALMRNNPALQYPASSMWPHFQESLSTFLEAKRRAIDGYNYEAKKSDRHSNQVYLELINYFNGTLVADYNTYLKFSERDGYFGLRTIKFVPAFDIRDKSQGTNIEAKPFKDYPPELLKPGIEKGAIDKRTFEALNIYPEFINESWRQTNYLQSVLSNLSSSAAYLKTAGFEKRAPLHFEYSNFQLPLSLHQKVMEASRILPPDYAKTLNQQLDVLFGILKEMDDLCATLEQEVKERAYEKDGLAKVYSILERQRELFVIWDERKELLYRNVRMVFESFPQANPSGSWEKSGKSLRELADLDREALFAAKRYYNGDTTVKISTMQIDAAVRTVISNEYENMKGIQKYGRNNGLCPYTPYEDLPKESRQLAELFAKRKPAGSTTGYSHPYHSMVYLYNSIADNYNKFCELSTSAPHLKTIRQPEIFFLKHPQPKEPSAATAAPATVTAPVQHQAPSNPPPKPATVTASVVHDTVYIEKRDTVYLRESPEKLRSMEGYATNHMILLLDVSGSMDQPDKLPVLKKSMLDMLSMMRKEDMISIIAFSSKPNVLLKPTSFTHIDKINKAVTNLSSSGKTDGNAALRLAYKVADENYIRGGNNRIVLATDGEFIIDDDTRQVIENFAKEDIFLSVFNFGKGMGASRALHNLADLGKGNYESITKDNAELALIREVKMKRR